MPPLTGLSRESTEHELSLWVKEEEEEDFQDGLPLVHPVRRDESHRFAQRRRRGISVETQPNKYPAPSGRHSLETPRGIAGGCRS